MAHGNIEQRFDSSTYQHADANETLVVHLYKKNEPKTSAININDIQVSEVTAVHPLKNQSTSTILLLSTLKDYS